VYVTTYAELHAVPQDKRARTELALPQAVLREPVVERACTAPESVTVSTNAVRLGTAFPASQEQPLIVVHPEVLPAAQPFPLYVVDHQALYAAPLLPERVSAALPVLYVQGAAAPEQLVHVVLELGYFIGKLGRARVVCALYEGNVDVVCYLIVEHVSRQRR
jgi:hypothetical protein